jgi:putative SOS response-associated peptidase YedK
MCGRFSIIDGSKVVEGIFGARRISFEFETSSGAPGMERPIYNAAPSMTLPIIIDHYNNERGRFVVPAVWGLQIAHTKLRPQANARLDTIRERRMFKDAFAHRHCLVPANSFFEWHREKGIKQPYRIMTKDDSLFALAGIWERGEMQDSPPTFTLLTTEANEMMSKIHDRMPVIVDPKDHNKWLTAVGYGAMYNMEWQYPSAGMKMYPVSTKVNKVAYNEPGAIEPLKEPVSLFTD